MCVYVYLSSSVPWLLCLYVLTWVHAPLLLGWVEHVLILFSWSATLSLPCLLAKYSLPRSCALSPWTILSEQLFAELIPFFVLISVFHRKSVNRTLVRNTNDVYESKAPPSTQLLEVTPLTDENPTSPTSEEDGLEPLSGVEQLRGGSSVQWGPLTGRSVSFSQRGADGVGEDSMTATRCSSSSGLADALFPGSRASTAQRRVAASSLYQNSFTVLGGDVWEAAPDAEDSNPLVCVGLDGVSLPLRSRQGSLSSTVALVSGPTLLPHPGNCCCCCCCCC